MTSDITYTATETASAFHNDDSFVRLLLGPVGTGKTVACSIEPLKIAMQQAPGTDGIRRTRGAVIRNTYPDLISTTIATWKVWYPEEIYGKIKYSSPIVHHIKKGDIDCEVYFIALDSPDDVRKLRSLELTWCWVSEFQYLSYQVFLICTERVNRFPPKILGAPITWTGVFGDSNLPDTDHWIYKKIDAPRPKGYIIFRYRPAIIKAEMLAEGQKHEISLNGTTYIDNPECDYSWVQNDPNYWLNLVPGRTDEEIKVVLMGEYGIVMDGKPVHPTYNDQLHFSNRMLEYDPKVEIGLGWDFGLTPACAVVQLTSRGQLQVIDELWSEDMGLRDFASNIVIPHLDRYYEGWRKNYVSRHDPAGNTGSQTDGKSCQDILKELGIISYPAADNNDPTPRRDGLKYFLGKLVDGATAFIVSTKCPMIRKGLMGAYKYARVKVGGDERYHDKPLKNMYSHICEAIEYIAMFYAAAHKKPETSTKKPYSIQRGSFI